MLGNYNYGSVLEAQNTGLLIDIFTLKIRIGEIESTPADSVKIWSVKQILPKSLNFVHVILNFIFIS